MSLSQDVESKFELRAPVTPYICSTPVDFQEERDWLAERIFPELAELCSARGTYFSPVDVRWSADDPFTQEGHLLRTLLDLVSGSAPYFLCLLGECYGPYRESMSAVSDLAQDQPGDTSEVKDWLELNLTLAAECGYQWVLQDSHPHCSISELEIMAAALRGNSHQCTFYFRQAEHLDLKLQRATNQERAELCARFLPESEHAGLKVQGLKQTIVKRGLPVRYFKTLAELGNIVTQDWAAILDTVCPPLVDSGRFLDTAHYQHWLAREALLAQLRTSFVQTEEVELVKTSLSHFALTAIDEQPPAAEEEQKDSAHTDHRSAASIFRQKPPPPPAYKTILLLTGDRGVGKSVALAHWLQDFAEENPGIYLIHHFIGASPGDNDIAAFLHRCTRDLRKHFLLTEVTGHAELDDSSSWWSEEDRDTPSSFHALCQAFVAALGLGPCILLLDGINYISSTLGLSQQEVKEFDWLPTSLPRHCRIILSTSRADLTYRSLCDRGDVEVVTLPGVKDNSLIMSYLKTVVKRHALPFVQTKERYIIEMRMLTSALAVRVLGTEVNVQGVFTHLDEFVDSHCEITALRSLWTHYLQVWVSQHSWTRDDDDSVTSKDDGLFDYAGWVADALCLLTVSRGGLRQDEVLQLLRRMGYAGSLEVRVLHWLRFRLRVGGLLWETADGRIRFCHQHLHDITQYTLLRAVSSTPGDVTTASQEPHHNSKRKVHAQLADFFSRQPLSWRQAQELPWHLLMAGDLQGLLTYLTHSRVVELFLARRDQYPDAHHDLRLYWSALKKHGQQAGPHYLSMLRDVGLYTLPSDAALGEREAPAGAVQSWLEGNTAIVVSDMKDDDTAGFDALFTSSLSRRPASPPGPGAPTAEAGDTAVKRKLSSPTDGGAARPLPGKRTTPPSRADAGTAGHSTRDSCGRQSLSVSPTRSREKTGRARRHSCVAERTGPARRPSVSRTRRHSVSPGRACSEAEGAAAGEEEPSVPERQTERRPFTSPFSYRLSPPPPALKEVVGEEPPRTQAQTRPRAPAGRKVASAQGRRGAASSTASRPPLSSSSSSAARRRTQTAAPRTPAPGTSCRPASGGRKGKTVTVREEGEVQSSPRAAFRPASAPHQQPLRSQTVRPKPAPPTLPFGFCLTSPESLLNIPDILEGLGPDDRKWALAELSWAVGRFLQDLGQTEDASRTFSALLAFLQASYPLPLSSQLLLVRVLERLGTIAYASGDSDSAVCHYHQALRITFDLDVMEEDLCDHRQLDTFKGVLLGHHGYLRMQEGDVVEGGELLKEATESIAHLTGNHVLRAALLFHLGLFRGHLGEVARSKASLRQCLALRQQWHGQVHPEVATVLLALARLINSASYKDLDEHKEAEALYRRALAVSERCLGPTHQQVALVLQELGELVAEEENRIAKMEARQLLQRSLDIRTTTLGVEDASTRATRASVRRVELSLQPGNAEALSSRPEHMQHMAVMPQRDMRLPYMGGRAGPGSRGGASPAAGAELGGMDIRSVSREKVLLHNRPESIVSSVFSLLSPSERLLASRPVSSKSKGSRVPSAASSAFGAARGTSVSVGWSSKTAPVEVRLDLDEEAAETGEGGEGPGTSTPRGPGRGARTVMVDLDLSRGEQEEEEEERRLAQQAAEVDTSGQDTPHLDSFALHLQDGTIIIGEEPARGREVRRRVKVRPHSTPHRLFRHYATIASDGAPAKPRPRSQRSANQSRRSWSARTAASSLGSHVSRCSVPGPYDHRAGSETDSLCGPHAAISALLGPPQCPRDNVRSEVHHRSAFYHVPGRYPTSVHSYPPRRSQKTEGARILEAVLARKLSAASESPTLFRATPPSSAAPRSLGVNQYDVSTLVRQTGVNRPDSRASAILASARGTSDADLAAAPAVKFREPVTVS